MRAIIGHGGRAGFLFGLTFSVSLDNVRTVGAAESAPPPAAITATLHNPLIGVNYFAGWWPELPNKWQDRFDQHPWLQEYPGRTPLLGATNTPETMDREILAAAEHGVDFFSILWYPQQKNIAPGGQDQTPMLARGLTQFMTSTNASHLKFMVEFCNHSPFLVPSDTEWEACVATFVQAMRHPSYLKVDGRAVFKIHSAYQFHLDASNDFSRVKGRLDYLRDQARAAGIGELVIGAGAIGAQVVTGDWADLLYDFSNEYMMTTNLPAAPEDRPYSEMLAYGLAQNQARATNSIPHLPFLGSGWNPRPWYDMRAAFAFPTRAEWAASLRDMNTLLKQSPQLGIPRQDGSVQSTFIIYAWNEFGEGGIVAPTQGDGMMKLEVIHEFVTSNAAANQAFPPPVNGVFPAEGVTNDLFDISSGARIFIFSPTLNEYPPHISDPRDILGATRSSVEPGHTLFATGSVNQTRSVRFRTATHVILTNFQLRVQSDNIATSNRALRNWGLYGSSNNITYTLISSNTVGVPYNTNPGISTPLIMFSGTVKTPPYQFFRLDIKHGFTDGPRIIELDGFGHPVSYGGIVKDPIVFNTTSNAASTTTYLDEDPGYATSIRTSSLTSGFTTNTDGKFALGAVGGPELHNLVFTDTAITRDSGDMVFNNGGETIHWISWDTTQPLTLAGINLGLSPLDRPARLMRFSVNGVAQVFKDTDTDVFDVTGVTSASNLLFSTPVKGSSFKLEFTGGTNPDGNAYGPRLGEIDAVLFYTLPGTLLFLH